MNIKNETIELIEKVYGGLLPSQEDIIKQDFFNFFINNDEKLLILNAHTRAGKDTLTIATGYIGLKKGYWDKVVITYPAYVQNRRLRSELEKIVEKERKTKIVVVELRGKTHKHLCIYPKKFKPEKCRINKILNEIRDGDGLIWIDYKKFSDSNCPYYCLINLWNRLDKVFLVTHHDALEKAFERRENIDFHNSLLIMNEFHRVLKSWLPSSFLIGKYELRADRWTNSLESDFLTSIIRELELRREDYDEGFNNIIDAVKTIYNAISLTKVLEKEISKINPSGKTKEELQIIYKEKIEELLPTVEEKINSSLLEAQKKIEKYLLEYGNLRTLKNEIYKLNSPHKYELINLLTNVYNFHKILDNHPENNPNVYEFWSQTYPILYTNIVNNFDKILFLTGSLTDLDVYILKFNLRESKFIQVPDNMYSNVYVIGYRTLKKGILMKNLNNLEYQFLIITTSYKNRSRNTEEEVSIEEKLKNKYPSLDLKIIKNYDDFIHRSDKIPVLVEGSEVAENLTLENIPIAVVDKWVNREISRYGLDLSEYTAKVSLYQILSRIIKPNEPRIFIMPVEAYENLKSFVPAWRYIELNNVDEVLNKIRDLLPPTPKKIINFKVGKRELEGKERVIITIEDEKYNEAFLKFLKNHRLVYKSGIVYFERK